MLCTHLQLGSPCSDFLNAGSGDLVLAELIGSAMDRDQRLTGAHDELLPNLDDIEMDLIAMGEAPSDRFLQHTAEGFGSRSQALHQPQPETMPSPRTYNSGFHSEKEPFSPTTSGLQVYLGPAYRTRRRSSVDIDLALAVATSAQPSTNPLMVVGHEMEMSVPTGDAAVAYDTRTTPMDYHSAGFEVTCWL